MTHRALAAIPLLLLLPRIASAQPSNLDLTWQAPPECATRAEILERVGRLLGDGNHPRQKVRAQVVVTPNGKAYRAELDLASGDEASAHRSVDGESCPAVQDAVVTIVALAIDPEATLREPSPPPPRAPAPPAPVPSPPVRFSVGVAARFDFGSEPAGAFGGQAIVGASWRGFGAEVDGSLLASARATTFTEGADISMREVGGRLSYALSFGRLELGPRVGMHARWLFADGFGSTTPHHGSAAFGVFSAGGLAKYRVAEHVAFRAAADLGIPLSRPTFDIDAVRVYGVTPQNVALTLGAELVF